MNSIFGSPVNNHDRRWNRRSFLNQCGVTVGSTAALIGWRCSSAFGQGRTDFDSTYTSEIDASIERGIDLICDRQILSGGFETDRWGENAAVVALCGIALLSRGVRPGFGPRGIVLQKVASFILSNCAESGLISSSTHESHREMYEHGFSTLFLAEYYGVGLEPNIRSRLNAAVEVIAGSQNEAGGWRYEPRPNEADLSVTVCQMMALRAALNAGVAVDSNVIDAGIEYIRASQNADGGFTYRQNGGKSRYPISMAAIVALNNAGVYEGEVLDRAFEYADIQKPIQLANTSDSYFYYAHYYSVQAYRAHDEADWNAWYARLAQLLLKQQLDNGGWHDYNSIEYGTAMACIMLNMPRTVLPIFQR